MLGIAGEYFSKIIRTCGDTAVEFEPRAADQLREEMRLLESQFQQTAIAQTYQSLRRSLETYQNPGDASVSAGCAKISRAPPKP